MSDEFVLCFPVYTLWMPEGPSPYMLRGGSIVAYPIFTDHDSVITYRKRQNIGGVSIMEMAHPNDLIKYILKPPCFENSRVSSDVTHVVFDPMQNTQSHQLMSISDLLKFLGHPPHPQ